ncbi:hypothetical protein [Sorangium sp. So ce1097]|uniref:hypothetical protein n=1 Tax=Sorangium sp. So ce1097 TaxID=3133330 RepID=UPI003F64663D
MRRTLLFSVGFAWTLLGCGTPPPGDDGSDAEAKEPTDVAAQALGSACNERDLAWPSGVTDAQKTCSVPWEYRLNCFALRSTNACDFEGYEAKECKVDNKVCDDPGSPRDGDPATERQATETRTYGPTTVSCIREDHRVCNPNWHPPCQTMTTWDCDTPCQALATTAKNGVDPDGRPNVTTSITVTGSGPSATCRYTLFNYPVCYEPCPDTTRPIYETCRHSSHGTALAGSCGTAGETKRPPSGTSLRSVLSDANSLWQTPSLHNEGPINYRRSPLCRTCEDLPLSASSSTAEVRAKFDCLRAQLDDFPTLPDAAGGEALKAELVSRLKLLAELKLAYLDGPRRHYALNLYVTEPALRGSCGSTFTPPAGVPASCDASGSLTELNLRMDMCVRMSSAHAPASTAETAIGECLQLAAQVAAVSEECQGLAYRAAFHEMWLNLLRQSMSTLGRTGVDRLPDSFDLWWQLHYIDSWYNVVRTHFYPGPTAYERLWGEASDTLGVFWKAVYGESLVTADSATPELMTEDPLNRGLQLDQAVLLAALTPVETSWLPLEGPVLLMLLSDGLRGLHERIQDFSALHDLGCRFKGCENNAVRTEVSELWSLFAAAADPARLPGAVSGATELAASPHAGHSGWRSVFDQLAQRRTIFEEAVKSSLGVASYSPALLSEPDPDLLTPPVVAWAKMVQQADAAAKSYARAGIFLSTSGNTLRTGIQEAKRTGLDQEVQRRETLLADVLDDYRTHRAQYVTSLLAQMGNASNQDELQHDMERRAREFLDLNEDLVGLQDGIAKDEVQFGSFAAAFNTVLEQEGEIAELAIQRAPVVTLNISAGDARYAPGASGVENDVLRFAVQRGGRPVIVSASKGDILNFKAAGLYAPTCAMRRATPRNPWEPGTTSIVSVPTGPSGYIVTYEDGVYHAYSAGAETFWGESQTERTCAGASGSLGFNFYGTGGAATATLEDCISFTNGSQYTTSNQSGYEARTTASFATGLRLRDTPFPDAPVGSLLLVEMPRGGTLRSQIRDVRVIQEPNTSVVVESDEADHYLVVNDRASCTSIDTARALTVDLQHLMPVGAAAEALGQAMAQAIAELRSSVPAKLAQGRISASELGALRDAARLKLVTAFGETCPGCEASQMPAVFHSLFEAFVSKELARVERLVQIYTLERAMESLLLEFQFLRDDLASGEEKARLLDLIPLWSLRNLDGQRLRESMRSLSGLVTDYLYPVMDLRYPTAIASVRNHAALTRLVRANWSTPFPDLSALALDAVGSIKTALANARTSDPLPSYTSIALSFPRPDAVSRGVELSSLRKADSERSEAIWTGLLSTGTLSVTITPEDLYALSGGEGQLTCFDGTPILHTMAIYLARPNAFDNDSLNGRVRRVPAAWASRFAFTGEDVTKTYTMDNPLFLVGSPRVLYGNPNEALSTFAREETLKPENNQNIAGDGLSPFGTIRADMSFLLTETPSPLDEITELMVTMQVDRRTVLSSSDPAVCQ